MPSARDVFEILVRENSDMLWGYLRSTVYDTTAAEDIYQECLLVAWRRLDTYDSERPFGAWLRGIAGKLVLAYFRKTKRQGTVHVDEATLEALSEAYQSIDSSPGDTWDEKVEALYECLDRLKARDRKIIDLHYSRAHDCKAIAEQVDMTFEAVKKRLQRSRTSLAECIDARMDANQRIREV